MTKFEELNKVYTKAEEDFKDYRWKSINFAIKLGKGFADYLECDYDEIQYYRPPDNKGKAQEAHPRDAVLIDVDTSWHYGMGVNLYLKENQVNPAMTYIFDFALKKDNGNYLVRLDKEKKEFTIDPNNPDDFIPLYDTLYSAIKSRFEEELDKFLSQKSAEHYPEYG